MKFRRRNLSELSSRELGSIVLGAAVGAGIRWVALSDAQPIPLDAIYLLINTAGAGILGTLAHWNGPHISRGQEALIGAGFCGALTTWSSLALLTADHLKQGRFLLGVSWLAANIILGVAAAGAAKQLQSRRVAPTSGAGLGQ